jgi:hypothetical protein
MKYFTELLESYSRLKKRKLTLLSEIVYPSTASRNNPAEAEASTHLRNAKAVKPLPTNHKPYQVSGKNIVIFYSNNAGIWKASRADARGAALGGKLQVPAESGTDTPSKELIKMFGEGQPTSKKSEMGMDVEQGQTSAKPGGAAGMPLQPAETYPWIEGPAIIDQSAYERTVDLICKEDKKKCKQYKQEYWRLLNDGKSGTVGYTVSRTRATIKECDDDICISEINENESTRAKESAGRTIQKALRLLSKESPLSLEEADWLKKNINVSKKNQIIIIDRLTGEGILITQERTTLLLDFLKDSSKLKTDPHTNEPLNLQGDSKLFLDNAGAVGGAKSTVRGFFFEDVTEATIKMDQCKDLEGPALNSCEREATKIFEKYLENKTKVIDSFQDLIDHYSKDGEVSIDLRNELDRFLMSIADGRSENATKSFQIFVNKIQRLAVIGTRLRNPKGVERSSLDVGFNRKADLKELYNTREDAVRALEAMGLGDLAEEGRIVQRLDGKFEIGNSLKFSTGMEEVILGQAAASNIKGALNGTACNDPKTLGTFNKKYGDASGAAECAKAVDNQKRFWKESGITDSDLTFITREFNQYEREAKLFENLPEIQEYLNKDGTVSSRFPRKLFLNTFKDHLIKNGSYGGLQQDMVNEIESILAGSSRRPWPEVAANIAKVAQKRRLENMYQSSDPKEKERAVSFVAGLAVFGGGSVDNSMLTVVDGFKGDMYVTDQNRTLSQFVNLLKNRKAMKDAKIKFNHGSFVFGDEETGKFVISFDGSQSSCVADMNTITRSSRKFSSQRGADPEQKRADASHKLAKIGITLAEAIKKYSETLKLITD